MPESVLLYRTVSAPEYHSLQASGRFRSEGGAEGKYFWERQRAAVTFGERTRGHYHPDGYRAVEAEVLAEVARSAYRWAWLDGVGPARFIPSHQLARCSLFFLDSV